MIMKLIFNFIFNYKYKIDMLFLTGFCIVSIMSVGGFFVYTIIKIAFEDDLDTKDE